MKLYIIRHGETEWNQARRLQGQTDIPLAEEGIRLAGITGEKLKEIPFAVAYTSPLKRAVQTAEYVLAGRDISIKTDERIQEISFGEWEGECLLDSKVLPGDFTEKFFKNPVEYLRPSKGENFQDVCQRTENFLQELISKKEYQDANILISTHGAAGRCLLNYFYGDNDIWRGSVPTNCAISIVEVKNGRGEVLERDKVYY